MKRKALFLILCLSLVIAFVGCGDKAAEEKTLVYGSMDYTAINPALYEHGEINLLLFVGLTAHDAQNNIIPAAAESWTYDSETLTYLFQLREGVTFHDGQPLTANDVKFTIEAICNPENGSENASNFADIAAVEVIDELSVAIKLSAPNVAILDYLTIGILPAHLLEDKDLVTADFNRNPIGAGPYKLVKWDKGQSIMMEKFDDFCLGAPKIDKVVFKIVSNNDARTLQLLGGKLDLAQITPKTMEKFNKREGYNIYIMDTSDYRGILYNFNSDFFSRNKELPAILSYAIDREAIVNSILLGYGEAAYSPLQKSEYNNADVEKYAYNPQKAKRLLEEAGWKIAEDGYYYKGREQLAFTICNGQDDSVRIDMSRICAQNLQDIGVNATVKVEASIDWEHQDAYLIGWGSPFDPDDHTYKVFVTGQDMNYSAYANSKVDTLLLQGRATDEQHKRMQLYREFQHELALDPPYTFIAYINAIYAGSDKLTGITKDTLLGHHGVGIFHNIYEWDIHE